MKHVLDGGKSHERGRGLNFVELFRHDWGWYPTDVGKIVWTSFARY